MAKLVDAPDLGSGVLRRVGSSPIRRTIGQKRIIRENFPLFYFCNSLIIERLSRGLHSHQRFDNWAGWTKVRGIEYAFLKPFCMIC